MGLWIYVWDIMVGDGGERNFVGFWEDLGVVFVCKIVYSRLL